jgi:hypothetical protein
MKHFSASEFKTYIDCPYRWKKTFIEDRKILELENDEYSNLMSNKFLDFGIYIHACLEEYNQTNSDIFVISKLLLNKHKGITVDGYIRAKDVLAKFMQRSYNVPDKLIHAEKKFEFVTDNGVPLRGTIDAIYKNKRSIVVVDYKTGYNAFTEEYLKTDLQMMIYTLYAQHEYPEHEVSVILDNLNYEPLAYEYGENELDACKNYLEQKYLAITKDEKCEPRLNQYCSWCSQLGNCPLLKTLEELKSSPIEGMNKENIGDAAKKYNDLAMIIKLFDTKKNSYYDFLTNAAKINDGEWKDKNMSVMLKNGKLYVKEIKK